MCDGWAGNVCIRGYEPMWGQASAYAALAVDSTILEQWAAAIAMLSLRGAHMGLAGPHDMGTEFVQQMLNKSQKNWLPNVGARAGLIKA